MSSVSIYDQIYKDNIHGICAGDVQVDPYLPDRRGDPRRGISLIIPIQGLENEYEALVSRFRAVAPEQYCYPFEDLHITVFDFVQASEDYTRCEKKEDDFRLISHEALAGIEPFLLRLRGPVFSRAAGLLAGYDDDILIPIRNDIRRRMAMRGLSNDERYESSSAHVTFSRFCSPLQDPAGVVNLIDACRDLHLGTGKVAIMELVEHDWYNSKATKRVIATFCIGRGWPNALIWMNVLNRFCHTDHGVPASLPKSHRFLDGTEVCGSSILQAPEDFNETCSDYQHGSCSLTQSERFPCQEGCAQNPDNSFDLKQYAKPPGIYMAGAPVNPGHNRNERSCGQPQPGCQSEKLLQGRRSTCRGDRQYSECQRGQGTEQEKRKQLFEYRGFLCLPDIQGTKGKQDSRQQGQQISKVYGDGIRVSLQQYDRQPQQAKSKGYPAPCGERSVQDGHLQQRCPYRHHVEQDKGPGNIGKQEALKVQRDCKSHQDARPVLSEASRLIPDNPYQGDGCQNQQRYQKLGKDSPRSSQSMIMEFPQRNPEQTPSRRSNAHGKFRIQFLSHPWLLYKS